MLEQQQTEEAKQAAFPLPPPAHAASALLSPPAQILIARYVAQTGAEQTSDMRRRLEALTLAYSELDAAPQQAVGAAIRHLESEQQAAALAAQQARQQAFGQRKRSRRAKQSARPATLTALKLFAPGALALIVVMLPALLQLRSLEGVAGQLLVCVWLFMYLGLPAVLGGIVGMRARHRAGMGTFYALAMLVPLVMIVSELVVGLSGHDTSGAWALGLIIALFWIPIGAVSAAATECGRDALRRKRRAQTADATDQKRRVSGAEI